MQSQLLKINLDTDWTIIHDFLFSLPTYLLKACLYQVRLINQSLFQVGQAVILQLVGLLDGDLRRVPDLGQERRQVIQFHLLSPQSLLLLQLLLLIKITIQLGVIHRPITN